MKKSIKSIILFAIFLGILMVSNNVFAASADLIVSEKDKIINVGDTIEVTVNVNAAQWDLSVSANGLDYVSGTKRFTELDNAEGNLSESNIVKYKANKAGEFNILLTGDVTDISGENSDISKTVKLIVEPQEETKPEKSNNAYLSTLGVKPKEYDFSGFNKETKTYNVTIPYEVNSLDVLYRAADGAKVEVTGNSGFKVGSDNKITIKVTAEDGKTTETYTIKVTKLAQKKEDTTSKPETPNTPITPEKPVEQPKEKSTNAYLSTLGITPKEYDFSGFKKTNLNYSVTIPYDVDSLKVLYKTEDSGATVKVTGNSNFEVGSTNKIKVKVTAEDGKTNKTYTIKVTKLAEEEEKPGNVIEDDEGLYLTSLKLDGVDISPEFSKDTYSYTAILEESDVTEIGVNATANKGNTSIDISGNKELVVGENTITIVVKQDGSSVQTVYQITLTKEKAEVITNVTEESNLINDLIGNIKNYIVIAVVIVVLIILAIIILIILLRKESNKIENEETEEEYNVYENDENEFESNLVKDEEIEETNETETKYERKTRRREKGKHSK